MASLNTEQQLFWDALKGAPYHTHHMAQDMMSVRGKSKRLNQRADQHLATIMRLYTSDEVIRIVYTWLTVYQLPLDARRLCTFDQFHRCYGPRVLNMIGTKITPY